MCSWDIHVLAFQIENYLLRNHETRKYLQEQAYRLQQGIVTSTTQQVGARRSLWLARKGHFSEQGTQDLCPLNHPQWDSKNWFLKRMTKGTRI